jgi:two-component system, chemotaxis family, sensor kinase CheA
MVNKYENNNEIDIDLKQFLPAFFEEARGNIDQFEEKLLTLNLESKSILESEDETINAIFRCAHSVKGNSATFGFKDISHFAHQLEMLLDRMRKAELLASPDTIDVLLYGADYARALITYHENGGKGQAPDITKIQERIQQQLQRPTSVPISHQSIDLQKDQRDNHANTLDGALKDRLVPIAETTIRVNIEKSNQLLELVGELLIAQTAVVQRIYNSDIKLDASFLDNLHELKNHSRDLKASVLAISMLPISVVFNRFSRLLRDLSSQFEKKVTLVTSGGAIELDRALIEQIIDPITHLIRNCIDHGIEFPQERIACGKPEMGFIYLEIFHKGSSIEIHVRDDGRGLSKEKILAKAREKNITLSETLTEQAIWQLIYRPGFSTAEQVTEISGRGVGMDVVMKNIKKLNGTLEMKSEEGLGATMIIKLPLTLAIMDAFIARIRSEFYILPMQNVLFSLPYDACKLKTSSEGLNYIEIKGKLIPIIDLAEKLGVAGSAGLSEKTDCRRVVSIVEVEGLSAALLIDELIVKQQIVIKNIQNNYKKIRYISDATLLGNGTIALILDIVELIKFRA